MTLQERLEKYSMPEPMSGCWLWTGAVQRGSRGPLYDRPKITVEGRSEMAYRASYKLHKGQIPSGKLVCHRCDTPLCVNPEHLWLGTNAENMDDMARKGRKRVSARVGELNPNAKLSTADAISIFKDPRRVTEIGRAFGVSYCAVLDIKKGRKWRSATEGLKA